jgi:uncharacterized membrane protein YvbJ
MIKMFCSQCGKKLPDDAKFCMFCGTKVITVDDQDVENKVSPPLQLKTQPKHITAENTMAPNMFKLGNYKLRKL